MSLYLGMDLGTTNVKVLAVDESGRVVAEGSSPVERFVTADGGVEQDIDRIWDAVLDALRRTAQAVDLSEAKALGISSQGGALQLLDDDSRPVGRVISWLDGRGGPYDESLTAELGEAFFAEHTGHRTSAITPGQVLRLRETHPAVLEQAPNIGYVGDCIVERLCGTRAHDATSLSIAMLLNPFFGGPDPELLGRLDIEEDRLPVLLAADEPAGELLKSVAETTGLPSGIPVSPAVHDQYAASIGCGCVVPGDISLGTGTAWVFIANSDALSPPVTKGAFACPHPARGVYGQMLSMVNGGSAVQWAVEMTGKEASAEAIDAALESVPAGSDGLRCVPLMVPSRMADVSQGRLEGITLAHGPGHLLRAVVEGLACELTRHLEMLAEAGIATERLVMSGTAAGSRVTPRILADTTGCVVSCVQTASTSTFGAAILARAMVERDKSPAEWSKTLAPAGTPIEPGENREQYQAIYEQYRI